MLVQSTVPPPPSILGEPCEYLYTGVDMRYLASSPSGASKPVGGLSPSFITRNNNTINDSWMLPKLRNLCI